MNNAAETAAKPTDEEIIDWLEEHGCGCALVSDDFGRWALATDGFQNVPENTDVPSDISTSFFIEAAEWQPSIREVFARRLAALPTPATEVK